MSEVILVGGSFLARLFSALEAAKAILEKSKNITLAIKTKFVQFMKNFLIKTIFFFGFVFLLPQAFAKDSTQFNRDLKNYNVKLQIFADQKKITEFSVALANSDSVREYGLMNLEKLNQKYGMLFVFDRSQIINMWMKNTLIKLDMIFIDDNNVIVHIAEDAKPLSLAIISSQKMVKKVLEINGGLAKKFGIKNGQKIVYENF